MESPEYKNLPPAFGTSSARVRQQLMGLVLQYVVVVTHSLSEEGELVSFDSLALEQHHIVGLIARAIHDFPRITPALMTTDREDNPLQILSGDLANNDDTIEFILRPVPTQETVNFWSAEDQRLPRLSLFVEARVAVLQPRPPESAAGIVLSVGNFIFPSTGPQLSGSRNELAFIPPGFEEPRRVLAIPARVPAFPLRVDATPPDTGRIEAPEVLALPQAVQRNRRLQLEGTNFGLGAHFLVLRRNTQRVRVRIDPPAAELEPINSDWEFGITKSAIELSVRTSVFGLVDGEATPREVSIVPGIYGARLILENQLPGSGPGLGSASAPAFPRSSNEVVFAVTPQITEVVPEGGSDTTFLLTALGDVFEAPTPPPGEDPEEPEIRIAVGGEVLQRFEPDGLGNTLGPREFDVVDASTLRLILGAPLAVGELRAVRLELNGAVAPPAWLPVTEGP
jgi:hypothetical protein